MYSNKEIQCQFIIYKMSKKVNIIGKKCDKDG